MFDGLRKSISNAVKGLLKNEKAAEAQEAASEARQAVEGTAEGGAPRTEGRDERKVGINVSAVTRLKGAFLGTVQLSDAEVDDFVEKLRVSLLESDVSYKTVDELLGALRSKLKAARFRPKALREEMVGSVRESLMEVLGRSGAGVNISDFIRKRMQDNETPVKILFLGPNGTGKTTTMGKIAYSLKKAGITSVFSASDTFRAAAIEQTEHHANAIGVPVIKSRYGADPASIAFDAIAYAKAHGIPVVLIDTAGRQETNRNLISEMQKMVRVAKPDLTIFIGESTAGNALAGQVEEFSKHIKIDGIILTKLDCDARGGNAISIADTTGIPVLFFGMGEGYDALVPYSPEFVVDSILPKN